MSSLKITKQVAIEVPGFGGDYCTVVVYQHADFTGWQAAFGEGDIDMDAFTGAGAVNDDASSVRIRGQDCKATFYQHAGFGGWAAGPFGEGDYDLGSLQGAGFVNDDMSSLKVTK
jgi:hypothetical protein